MAYQAQSAACENPLSFTESLHFRHSHAPIWHQSQRTANELLKLETLLNEAVWYYLGIHLSEIKSNGTAMKRMARPISSA
jgi:hypothetical protein